jgi:hypothetical protein
MDITAARGPRDSHDSAVGQLEQLADVGLNESVLLDRRLRDRRQLANASVHSTGLGVATSQLMWHVHGYCFD